MRKIIFAIGALLMNVMAVSAQYSIEVKPFTTTAGITSADEKFLEICINYNEGEQANQAQFNLTLPQGMTLDQDAMILEEEAYFPLQGGRVKSQPFSVSYNKLDDGSYNVAVSTTTEYYFVGHSGTAIKAYYLTDANMASGDYEIKIKDGVIAIPAAEGNGPGGLTSTSKVTIEGSGTNTNTDTYSIEVKPFTTRAGITSKDEKFLEICINYKEAEQANQAQFNLTLPQGMTLDEDAMILEEETYFPLQGGRVKSQPFSVSYNKLDDGSYNVAVSTTTEYYFVGHSGTAIMAYYLTDANMAPGDYEIKIKDGVIAIPAAEGNGPGGLTSTSKVTIENTGVGIVSVEQQVSDNAPVYTLGGQLVKAPTKGIYVSQGKKFIVK